MKKYFLLVVMLAGFLFGGTYHFNDIYATINNKAYTFYFTVDADKVVYGHIQFPECSVKVHGGKDKWVDSNSTCNKDYTGVIKDLRKKLSYLYEEPKFGKLYTSGGFAIKCKDAYVCDIYPFYDCSYFEGEILIEPVLNVKASHSARPTKQNNDNPVRQKYKLHYKGITDTVTTWFTKGTYSRIYHAYRRFNYPSTSDIDLHVPLGSEDEALGETILEAYQDLEQRVEHKKMEKGFKFEVKSLGLVPAKLRDGGFAIDLTNIKPDLIGNTGPKVNLFLTKLYNIINTYKAKIIVRDIKVTNVINGKDDINLAQEAIEFEINNNKPMYIINGTHQEAGSFWSSDKRLFSFIATDINKAATVEPGNVYTFIVTELYAVYADGDKRHLYFVW